MKLRSFIIFTRALTRHSGVGRASSVLKAVMVGLVTDKDSNVEKVSTYYSKFRVPMTKFMLEFAASKCLTTQTSQLAKTEHFYPLVWHFYKKTLK